MTLPTGRPARAGRLLLAVVLALASHPAAQEKQTFEGVITDAMCFDANHAPMRMGPTDAECATACVMAHGAPYALYDGKSGYTLSDTPNPEPFAGRRVRIVGTLNPTTRRIAVDSIVAAR